MVTLAAGAIAGSMTFLDKVAPQGRSLLVGAWISLAAALLCVLVSYHISVCILVRYHRAAADEQTKLVNVGFVLSKQDYPAVRELLQQISATKRAAESGMLSPRISPWLDRTAILLLMTGVTLLLMVASYLRAA